MKKMNIRRLIAGMLVLMLMLSCFAGCNNNNDATADNGSSATIQDVIAYLKAQYKDEGAETPVNFERFSTVRIAGVPFEVVWTASVGEEFVKITPNGDGTVTIDVNEECEEETKYALTATVTNDKGESVSHSWNYVLPEGSSMASIVDAAYALGVGEKLPYESTLTGKIISVDTVYSETYKNVTVTIQVEGCEDKPIQCFRVKGDGADQIGVGDIITVTGTLMNYNGKIEFDAGCQIDEWQDVGTEAATPDTTTPETTTPDTTTPDTTTPDTTTPDTTTPNTTTPNTPTQETDPAKIMAAAYALASGEDLGYTVTLTGKVTSIKTAYDSGYDNISVVISVADKDLLCYRMKGTGISEIVAGDTITVTGLIKNYNGTIEFDAGCTMDDRKSGGVTVLTDPVDIVNAAYALEPGKALDFSVTLTGEIISVDTPYSDQYNNITVTIKIAGCEDKPIKCFRLKGDGADALAVGDVITVTGIIKNYQHSSGDCEVEFDYGCTFVK